MQSIIKLERQVNNFLTNNEIKIIECSPAQDFDLNKFKKINGSFTFIENEITEIINKMPKKEGWLEIKELLSEQYKIQKDKRELKKLIFHGTKNSKDVIESIKKNGITTMSEDNASLSTNLGKALGYGERLESPALVIIDFDYVNTTIKEKKRVDTVTSLWGQDNNKWYNWDIIRLKPIPKLPINNKLGGVVIPPSAIKGIISIINKNENPLKIRYGFIKALIRYF